MNKSKNKTKPSKIIVSVFLIIFIFIILFLIAGTMNGVSFASAAKGISDFFETMSSGDGYPYEDNVSDIDAVKTVDGKLIILTNDRTYMLDNTAKKTSEQQHIYSLPALRTNENKYLVFDRGSGKIRLHNKSKIIWEEDLKQNILSADISSSGRIVAATKGKSSKCTMEVLSKSKDVLFKWECSSGYIVDVAISDNGKKCAAIVLSQKDAEILSTVYIFSLSSAEPTGKIEFSKSALFNVSFTRGNKIEVLGDNVRSIISSNNKREDDELFNSNTLANYYVSSNGNSVLQFLKYSGINSNIIVFYNEYGKEICRTEISSSVKKVACGESYFAVQCADKVYCYNRRGKKIGEIEVQGDIKEMTIIGSKCYVFSSGIINRYSVRNNIDK